MVHAGNKIMKAGMLERPPEPSTLSKGIMALPSILTTVAGVYAISTGIVTIIGWTMGLPRLTDWAGSGISMFPNAAVCSIACGFALICLKHADRSQSIRVAARCFGSLAMIIGGLTLLEHITGSSFGIDEVITHGTWGQKGALSPNRMGVPASTSFLLLGIGAILSTGTCRQRHIACILSLFPIIIASLSLVGYWFGASQLYGIARYTAVAWPTSTAIFALGIGLVAVLRDCGLTEFFLRPDSGGLMARRLLLPVIGIPLVLGWGRIAGLESGLIDDSFGTALRTLFEIALFLGVIWWTADCVRRHESMAHNAAKARYASEQRFIRFMHALPGLAWIKDSEGRYVYANEAAIQAFQRSKEELYGSTDADFLPEETATEFINNDRIALRQTAGMQFVESLRTSDGIVHSSLVTKFPIYGSDGHTLFVGGIAIDITDRLHAENELKDAHRRKDEFLATLAHELRNPLSPIRCSVEICRTQEDPEKLTWALDVIDRQVRQMARLLDDLLDISRISHGKLTLRRENVELARVIASAVETSQPLRDNVGQPLEIELPEDRVFLHADPVRLEQVFANLLNNAAKYAGRGSRVILKATTTGDSVHVSVRDNGTGIPAERLADIFEMFSQVQSTTSGTHAGLGIGLALVRGLVHLHSGKIQARSEGIGRGCEFIVSLPLHTGDPKGDLTDLSNEATMLANSDAAEPFQQSLRVLVTDDLPDSADSLSRFFRSKNHKVRTAYDGAEALTNAADFRPHVMLLDIGMPKLGGDEVCRRIRQEAWGKDVFIIAITGWGQESDRRLTAEAGFDLHLIKPVDIEELLAIVSRIASKDAVK
jgi:PAS domain S-box-containing protein